MKPADLVRIAMDAWASMEAPPVTPEEARGLVQGLCTACGMAGCDAEALIDAAFSDIWRSIYAEAPRLELRRIRKVLGLPSSAEDGAALKELRRQSIQAEILKETLEQVDRILGKPLDRQSIDWAREVARALDEASGLPPPA